MGKSHCTELEREFLNFLTEQKAKEISVVNARAISELP